MLLVTHPNLLRLSPLSNLGLQEFNGYVTGILGKPLDQKTEKCIEQLDAWETNNAKIITWVNNSVKHSIDTQLAKYEKAKEVQDHLTRLYTQSNFAKQYQLDSNIRILEQKSVNVQ